MNTGVISPTSRELNDAIVNHDTEMLNEYLKTNNLFPHLDLSNFNPSYEFLDYVADKYNRSLINQIIDKLEFDEDLTKFFYLIDKLLEKSNMNGLYILRQMIFNYVTVMNIYGKSKKNIM